MIDKKSSIALKQKRIEMNLSLREMASKLGISHTYLAMLEDDNDTTIPSREKMIIFAKVFKLDIKEIVDLFKNKRKDKKLIPIHTEKYGFVGFIEE